MIAHLRAASLRDRERSLVKTRNGFVSNSSSSSFVVQIREDDITFAVRTAPHNIKKGESKHRFNLLTKGQISKLQDEGFFFVEYITPSDMEAGVPHKEVPKAKAAYMALSLICNQDDMIELLVKNEIPFMASCHYGHETVSYPKGSDTVYLLPNPGLVHETYTNSISMKSIIKDKQYKIHSQSVKDIKKKGWYPYED